MGVISCKNCQCNKKEDEQKGELDIEGQQKEKIKETPGQFKNEDEKNDNLEIIGNNDENGKDFISKSQGENKGKDLASCKSQSKMSIEIHEDKIYQAKNQFINDQINENENEMMSNNEEDIQNNNLNNSKDNNEQAIENGKNIEIEKAKENYFSNDSNNINNIKTNALSPPNNNNINENEFSSANRNPEVLNESQVNNFQIDNLKKNPDQSTLEIAKIEFGIDNKNDLSLEDQKLYEEAKQNLNQFYPPEKNEVKQIQKKLKKISLATLLPKSKINEINLNENTLVFHGELKKLVNYEINAHRPQMYSSRFCTLTPKFFKYFKSKEQFLKNLKPQCTLPINQITRINFAKVKKNSKKIDHIIICNKLGIIKNKNKVLMDKFFANLNETSFVASPETNESLIIFTSEIEEFMLKWFKLIQFFIERETEKEKHN